MRSGRGGFQIGNLAPLNIVNLLIIHPIAFVALVSNAFGSWGVHADVVYGATLFTMLVLSAMLFLQIVSLISSD